MSKGYQFGDISKSIYNKVTNPTDSNKSTNSDQNELEPYKFGDLTKYAFHSIASQFKPFPVDITSLTLINQGFLEKRNETLLIYKKYWVVLASSINGNKSMYLFKGKPKQQKYDECVKIIDLSSYNNVQAIDDNYFDLISSKNNKRVRFYAQHHQQRGKWIKCLFPMVITNDIQPSNVDFINDDPSHFSQQCIAYYIIDLEYNHSHSGNPQSLLRNENFIIAAIIWGYIHEDDEKFSWELNKGEKPECGMYENSLAVMYGIGGGIIGPVKGMIDGAALPIKLATDGQSIGKPDLKLKIPMVLAVGILPITTIAGIILGVPKGIQDGYKIVHRN